jgi:Tfp pilus assembly protein PilX
MMTAGAPAQGQRGLVLFVALIVLVAMTLAGIGMVRSVDTANLIAGNLAFKQGTIQAADRGIEVAFQWLVPRATGTTLYNTDPAAGYFSAPPVQEPDWYDASIWANAGCVNGCNPDPDTGVTIRYMIHRLCNCAGTAPEGNCPSGEPNECMIAYDTSGKSPGGSKVSGAAVYTSTPIMHYRVTVRADGPRNTASVIQTMLAIRQ